MRLTGATAPRFRVVNVTLPAAGPQEQELVPTLVDERTGLPPRLALRWVMRSRRNAVSEKTLADGRARVPQPPPRHRGRGGDFRKLEGAM